METWRLMSEVASLAVLWANFKTYRGNLKEFLTSKEHNPRNILSVELGGL